MKSILAVLLLVLCMSRTYAENNTVSGLLTDTAGRPVAGASVALLRPSDSTLAVFGISNGSGYFEVKGVAKGDYILQVALLGFYTAYRSVKVEAGDLNTGTIRLQENPAALQEVVVSGEKVPIRMKGDTVEYNASSFSVKPNAAVEDLLRQLPGVEVDHEGNIKSRGKEVKKVLVDGKDFFGGDPKIATKNLPADAINKIQTYDKHSDQSEFTGIDDGQRDQTINLVLKDGKKTGYFGDVSAGGGTGDHYEAAAHVYRFRDKTQLAALGMLNNINQFGFSMEDYINFKGGLGGLMDGGGQLSFKGNSTPVNFGQKVDGNVGSGAAGLNYSWEPRKNNRFNISYLGNGADKQLDQQTTTWNFIPGTSYLQEDQSHENSSDRAHQLSSSWRNDIDSFHQLTFNASADCNTSHADRSLLSRSAQDAAWLNQLQSGTLGNGHTFDADLRAGYTQRFKGSWPVFKLNGSLGYSRSVAQVDWNNTTTLFGTGDITQDQQFQENKTEQWQGSLGTAWVRYLGRGIYLEPGINGFFDRDLLQRQQGLLPENGQLFDSLSPSFYRNAYAAEPRISLRSGAKNTQWNAGIGYRAGWITPFFEQVAGTTQHYQYLLPFLSWRHDFSGGRALSLQYSASVNLPLASQMLPVTNEANPLQRFYGNSSLRPEYAHALNLNYNHFDQFNMSSLFAYVNASYTTDKINLARTIYPDLSQDLTLVNTAYQADLNGHISYSRPWRSLGLTVSGSLGETYDLAISPVNGVNNTNNTWTHEVALSVGNRKKEKWDVSAGGRLSISDSRYSLDRQLNNTYYNYTGFAQVGYRPAAHWYLQASADVTRYTASSFDQSVTIPLLKAEMTRSFLKNDRAGLTLKAFDLLDRNRSITRISQLNYLMEQRSNIIGRYFMLTFSYRLSKVGTVPGVVLVR